MSGDSFLGRSKVSDPQNDRSEARYSSQFRSKVTDLYEEMWELSHTPASSGAGDAAPVRRGSAAMPAVLPHIPTRRRAR